MVRQEHLVKEILVEMEVEIMVAEAAVEKAALALILQILAQVEQVELVAQTITEQAQLNTTQVVAAVELGVEVLRLVVELVGAEMALTTVTHQHQQQVQ
jgi:hypothetical protein